jgi:hypothetical protein
MKLRVPDHMVNYLGRFSTSTLVSPTNSHSTDCSTLIIIIIIIIYELGLVQ